MALLLFASGLLADAEHDDPNARFAGEHSQMKRLHVPDEWTLSTAAEIETAALWVLRGVCKDRQRGAKAVISLLDMAASKQVTTVARLRTKVEDLGNDMSALHCAAKHGRANYVYALLAAGADPNAAGSAVDSDLQITPLRAAMIAASSLTAASAKGSGIAEVVQQLLKVADVTIEESRMLEHAYKLAAEGWSSYHQWLNERSVNGSDDEHVKEAEPTEQNQTSQAAASVRTEL